MSGRREPLFLARDTYRRRRLMDAARLLPFFGTFLFISPTLFADRLGTVAGLLYLFGGWLVIIGFAFLLARRLRKTGAGGDEAG